MISFTEALRIAENTAQSIVLEKEIVSLQDLPEPVCVEGIDTPLDIQPFDNATMDGFAVRLDDFQMTNSKKSALLEEVAVIAAGDAAQTLSIQAGTCMRIMARAPTPRNAEAVVLVEGVVVYGDTIAFSSMLIIRDSYSSMWRGF